jgi:ubiquinone/menaquinone biosynthesis C-methylase UbiE
VKRFICSAILVLSYAIPTGAQPQSKGHVTTGHDGPAPQGGHGDARPAGHTSDHMQHSFADVARYAKSFDDPARDAWQMPDRVIAALELKPGQVVADVGAGTGYFTVRLARSPAAPKVLAADIEESMLDYIRQRAQKEGLKNVIAVKASPERTNLPEPVDVVLIVDTYHHIANRVAYFTALRSLLRPGGRLAIVDFKKDSPEGPPVQFRFTPEQITAELTQAGFSLKAQHTFLPRQMYLIYAAN